MRLERVQKNLTISLAAPVKFEKSITYGEASYVYNARKIAVSLCGLFFWLIFFEHWKRSAKETGVRSQRSEVGSQRSDEGWKLYFPLCAMRMSTGHWLLDSLTSKCGLMM